MMRMARVVREAKEVKREKVVRGISRSLVLTTITVLAFSPLVVRVVLGRS
jgi:hypothetical protein